MSLNFGALALQTGFVLLSYILVDVRPDISISDETLGRFDAWVGKVVQRVECRAEKRQGYKRPGLTS